MHDDKVFSDDTHVVLLYIGTVHKTMVVTKGGILHSGAGPTEASSLHTYFYVI